MSLEIKSNNASNEKEEHNDTHQTMSEIFPLMDNAKDTDHCLDDLDQ